MQLGLCLPQLGPTAEGAKVADVARRAEEVGYDSLWVGDRLLTPESPQDLYPVGGTEEVPYPPEFTAALDPIVTLSADSSRRTGKRSPPATGIAVIDGALTVMLIVSPRRGGRDAIRARAA